MQSFLMLPMQRITRLPLLIDAIFSRLDSNSSEFEVCREALEIINKVKLRKFLHFCYDLFSKFRQQRWKMWINSVMSGDNATYDLDELEPTPGDGVFKFTPEELSKLFSEKKMYLAKY